MNAEKILGELNNILDGCEDFAKIWDMIKDNDQQINKMILCTLADAIAGKEDKHGYELVVELLPVMYDVGETAGKITE